MSKNTKNICFLFLLLAVLLCLQTTVFARDDSNLFTQTITVSQPAYNLFTGGGTAESPYIITNAEQFIYLAERVNEGDAEYSEKHYKMENDVDLSDYGANHNGGKGWIPIGIEFIDGINSFNGVFDGANQVITGLYINDSSLTSAGLFGVVTNGIIKNLGIEGAEVNAGFAVGAVAGLVESGGEIINCYSTGIIKGNPNTSRNPYGIGGIAGRVHGKIINCFSSCTVNGDTGNSAGGITGYLHPNGVISNCYSNGRVNGYINTAGIAGYTISALIENCYFVGSLSANNVCGITIGDNTTVKDCAALNESIYSNSEAESYRIAPGFYIPDNALINNAAYKYMTENGVNLYIEFNTGDGFNGEDLTAEQINADGTIGGRFTAENGWTVENGKLPGLNGSAVDMPDHLKLTDQKNGWSYEDEKYFHYENGEKRIGWLPLDGEWYYLNPDDGGARYSDDWLFDYNNWYYFYSNGVMYRNVDWFEWNGLYFFFDENGAMYSERWYLMREYNKYFYFHSYGNMYSDEWLPWNGDWYYFYSIGFMYENEWFLLGEAWYYFYPGGAMATGTIEIDGVVHEFGANGAWKGYAR